MLFAQLLTSGLMFLAGMNKDGTNVGLAVRQNGFEYTATYMTAPKQLYGIKNPFDLARVPTLYVLAPLLGKDRLDYSCVSLHSFKVWPVQSIWPMECSVGINGKVWIYNHRDYDAPFNRYTVGPSATFAVYSTDSQASGLRFLVDGNALGFQHPHVIGAEVSLFLFIKIDFDWDTNLPPKLDD